jgi:hypothetical protein
MIHKKRSTKGGNLLEAGVRPDGTGAVLSALRGGRTAHRGCGFGCGDARDGEEVQVPLIGKHCDPYSLGQLDACIGEQNIKRLAKGIWPEFA